MNNKNNRATSNLEMLEFVARKLGKLTNEVVFLGGCTTALFITDPISLDVRPTLDVDCIVDVISLGDYYQFENKLKKQGFKKSMEEDVVCRWNYDSIILDVMPTDEKILGFGNRWYKAAVEYAIANKLSTDLTIKSVTAPYFLATKLEAFKMRGKNDFLGSHDFEDIIAVIDGRKEVADEIALSDIVLKTYFKNTFTDMLKKEQFYIALPGHLNYGSVAKERTETVLRRIRQITNIIVD